MGDVTTAAIAKPVNTQYVLVKVADTTLYQGGDRIILGAGSTSPLPNVLKVNKIVSGTVLQCQSESEADISAWPSGTIIALAIACFKIDFQTQQNSGIGYLGTDNTVTNAGLGSVIRGLGTMGDWEYVFHNGQNPLNTSEVWMAGTSPDKIIVAAHIC
jgi:hypothetical protein